MALALVVAAEKGHRWRQSADGTLWK